MTTNPLLRALRFASRSCGCESYHDYVCGKCWSIVDGEMPDMEQALELGLVSFSGCDTPELTPAGVSRLAALEKASRKEAQARKLLAEEQSTLERLKPSDSGYALIKKPAKKKPK